MQIFVKVREGKVAEVSFLTYGCAASIASCSILTGLAKGKKVEEVQAIGPAVVTQALGGLPLGKEHCPTMAVSALRKAIEAAMPPGRQQENVSPRHDRA